MKKIIFLITLCGIVSAYELPVEIKMPDGIKCNMNTPTNDFRPVNETLYWSLFYSGMRDIQITAMHPEKEGNGLIIPFLKMGTIFYVSGGIVLFAVVHVLFIDNSEVQQFPNIGLLVMNVIEMAALSSWGLDTQIKVVILMF